MIRLVTYVRIPRDTHRRKITRRAVFARDDWTCQYCGSRSNLTVDHVIPRSKGGGSSWDNIVASCAPCNRRKGDALPRQVGMRLLKQPRTPSPHVFIQVASPTIPVAWQQYLGCVGCVASAAARAVSSADAWRAAIWRERRGPRHLQPPR